MKTMELLRKIFWVRMMAIGLPVLVLGACGSTAQPPGAADPVRIDVTMNEFSFSPQPLRIPAGRPVTLVLRNAGKLAHEFMAGREPHEGAFEQDLFAGVQVTIEKQGAAAGSTPPPAEQEHAAAQEHAPVASEPEHAAGEAHGTMVAAEAGDVYLMTFTLPAATRGEWVSGCFLKGHFESGMRGTIIVE